MDSDDTAIAQGNNVAGNIGGMLNLLKTALHYARLHGGRMDEGDGKNGKNGKNGKDGLRQNTASTVK